MRSKLWILALLVSLVATAVLACQPPDRARDTPGGTDGSGAVGAVGSDTADGDAGAGRVDGAPYNVLVVVVDDASDIRCTEMRRFLPASSGVLRGLGTCFEHATVTSPACCPSRAVLQTGQLGHNSGVTRQIDAPLLRVDDTLQSDLTEAGWDTYGVGKFFNGISPWLFESGQLSSGFAESDFWAGSQYYDYTLWDDEAQEPRVPDERMHATTRTGTFLREFLAERAGSSTPFYAYAAFKAPHTDNAAPTEAMRFPVSTERNRTRSVPPFRWRPEADRRDKMSIFRGRLKPRSYYQRLYTARTRAMYDIDDELAATFAQLQRQGELDRTAVFVTSDNGYHLGENGWETKGDPYQASMDVPLLAFLPEVFEAGAVDTRPVGLIDIAPTVYDLAGVEPEHVLDGHSLLDPAERQASYFELENERSSPLLKEAGFFPARVPTWAMIRNGVRSYIEFYRHDGSLIRAEFYRDAQFQRNLLWPGFRNRPDRPSTKELAAFRTALHRARTCAGTVESGAVNPCP